MSKKIVKKTFVSGPYISTYDDISARQLINDLQKLLEESNADDVIISFQDNDSYCDNECCGGCTSSYTVQYTAVKEETEEERQERLEKSRKKRATKKAK